MPADVPHRYASRLITPRLARRAGVASATSRAWVAPEFGASTAFISLSPGLVCVFDAPGERGLTHQAIGARGLSVQQAWNASADTLLSSASRGDNLEFWVRPAGASLGQAAPAGFEIRGGAVPAASWLAHPRTFNALHAHCADVFAAEGDLTFFSRDQRELFVFTAPEGEVIAALGEQWLFRYSLGFPLLAHREPAAA